MYQRANPYGHLKTEKRSHFLSSLIVKDQPFDLKENSSRNYRWAFSHPAVTTGSSSSVWSKGSEVDMASRIVGERKWSRRSMIGNHLGTGDVNNGFLRFSWEEEDGDYDSDIQPLSHSHHLISSSRTTPVGVGYPTRPSLWNPEVNADRQNPSQTGPCTSGLSSDRFQPRFEAPFLLELERKRKQSMLSCLA
ncbi:hypothetical protein U1Q18_001720 [Sarracenia purpurea var. burkii]